MRGAGRLTLVSDGAPFDRRSPEGGTVRGVNRRQALAMAAGAAAAATNWASAARADEKSIRIGVLKFGTVSWMLDVLRRHRLDKEAGIRIEIVELAASQATQ